jgi:hypothetical protein
LKAEEKKLLMRVVIRYDALRASTEVDENGAGA